ncbi:MAG: HDIG domain-containing protein [Candidatus Brocadiia bacterium]
MRQNSKGHKNGAARGEASEESPSLWGLAARAAWLLLFVAAVVLIMNAGRPPLGIQLGQQAPRDYRARVTFTSVDMNRTEAAREEARRDTPPVFGLQRSACEESIQQALARIRQEPDALAGRVGSEVPADSLSDVAAELQGRADALEEALKAFSERHLVAPETLDDPLITEKTTSKARIVGPTDEEQEIPLSGVHPLAASAEAVREVLDPALEGMDPSQASLARRVLVARLTPPLALEVELSRDAAQRAAEAEPMHLKTVEAGRTILSKGTEVRRQHVEDLQRERQEYWAGPAGRAVMAQRVLGVGLLVVILTVAGLMYVRRYKPELARQRLQMGVFLFLTVLLVALARLCVINGMTLLWAPVPMMVMVMCLVYGQRFGLGTAVFFALLVRMAGPGSDVAFAVLLVGGLMAALLTGQVRTRGALVKAGLLAGIAQFVGVWGLGLVGAQQGANVPLQFWRSPLLADSLIALANGFLSGFIVSGGLPAIERLFGVTTDIRLLEWSDPNQPLLQKLLLDAPGSYHHSMLVGSLAADSAEAIGANPLLARVSAYFHDVGKLKKPEYFSENITEGTKNPHEELAPTMSSLIITAHPKDGAEMAEQYGLPKEVRDIILQSHGSSVLKYFWDKAQEEGDDGTRVKKHDFRYRLPKPRSREAAIVMLCDAVESATRSLESPDPGQVGTLVRDIIYDRLHDGQLDESGLTITDLKRLQDSLVHGVLAIYHNRIRYPGQEEVEEAVPSIADRAGSEEPQEQDEAGSLQQTEQP